MHVYTIVVFSKMETTGPSNPLSLPLPLSSPELRSPNLQRPKLQSHYSSSEPLSEMDIQIVMGGAYPLCWLPFLRRPQYTQRAAPAPHPCCRWDEPPSLPSVALRSTLWRPPAVAKPPTMSFYHWRFHRCQIFENKHVSGENGLK